MTFRRAVITVTFTIWTLVSPGRPGLVGVAFAAEGASAVVFAYGRFGEDQSPSNSIRIDQFEAHIDELTTGSYTVLPLPKIIEALKAGEPLPDRTIAITIDDATRSFYTEAWPRLRAVGLPFTLFIATDPVDRGSGTHMTWGELRQLQAAGVTIGGLGATTMSLVDSPPEEVLTELRRMMERLRAELGLKPALFAYPEGEYSTALQNLAGEQGFTAAFGQQSGVLHPRADPRALPRFVMNEIYGGVERFRLAANALPLPVSDLTPEDSLLTVNPPSLGFTVSSDIGDLSRLACFASGQGRTRLERIENRIEVRISDPFPSGRARVNCTLPTTEGRWRWFGVQFVIPEDDDD